MRICDELRGRAKIRFLSRENPVPGALKICAIVRKNCADARKSARARANSAPVARKFGPGRVRILFDCAKKLCECAIARRSDAVARKPGSGRVRNLATARKTARMREKVRERAQMRHRSYENAAPVALAICAIARKNCADVRRTVRARANPAPVARDCGPCRVINSRDCAKKLRARAKTPPRPAGNPLPPGRV